MGLLLTAAGIAGIVLIGSDNTVDSPTTTVKLADAKAVVSTPSLLAFTDTTMRLSVKSSTGAVFVGRAHPIDAKSYLAGAPTYAVTKVDTSGMHGELVKGDAKLALADPAKQTFWTTRATGAGTQTLTMKLDGTPTQYVVMPVGKAGDLTMTSGVEIRNGFALSIAALVLGLLGLGGGLLLMRRRTIPTASGTAAVASAETKVADEELTAPSRTLSRVATVGVIGALLPALAGCGVVPTKVDAWKSSELTKPAMADKAEAVAAMKDYDSRNNAAIAAVAKAFTPAVWEGVDSGVILAGDRLDTRYAALTKKWEAKPITTTVNDVYASAWSGYPMYAFVSTSQQVKGGEPQDVLVIMRREGAASPWVMDSKAWHDAALPGPARAASPLRAADQTTAMKVANAAMTSLNGGKGGPALPKPVAEYLAQERTLVTGYATATAKADFFNTTRAASCCPMARFRPFASMRACWSRPRTVLGRNRPPSRGGQRASGTRSTPLSYQEGARTAIRSTMAVTLTMVVDPQGSIKVVGRGFQFVI